MMTSVARAAHRLYVDVMVDEWGSRRWVRARIASMFFLLFLSWPIGATLHDGRPVPYQIMVLIGLAAYAASFLAVIWRNTPQLHGNRAPYAIVASLLIGGALVLVFGRQWLGVMTYFTIAMLLFNCRTNRWTFIVVGVPLLHIIVARYGFGDRSVKPLEVAGQALLIGCIQAAFYLQIASRMELRRARADLARLAVSEERLRISRDLHDILGQQLSALSLKAEVAARLAGRDAERAAAEMIEVAAVARAALADVRETVSGYRTMSLCGEVGTAQALLTAARVQTRIDVTELPAPLDTCGAWVIREAVTNVIRHANARHCEIKAVRTDDSVVVEVRDDGGTTGSPLSFGNGLTGLSERVAAARGELSINADRGWFVVRATFGTPVPAAVA